MLTFSIPLKLGVFECFMIPTETYNAIIECIFHNTSTGKTRPGKTRPKPKTRIESLVRPSTRPQARKVRV